MSLLSFIPFVKSNAPDQVISEAWEDRNKILNDGVNLFCWKRPENPDIHQFLQGVLNSHPQPIQVSVNKVELPQQLENARKSWEEHQDSINGEEQFWQDIFMLVNDFLDYSTSGAGTVHLRVISDDSCRKFHTDGYPLRLFTTYLGRGTEWLPEKATNRKGLGKSNDVIVKRPALIQRMKPFEVGILKGEIPGRQRNVKGVVHRSPEIAQNEEKRITLRVDIN